MQQALSYANILRVPFAFSHMGMALCDRLEAALTTTDSTRTRLLEALLYEALEPSQDVMEAAE